MKNIRKFLCLALALIMVLSLAACGSKSDDAQDNNDDAQQTAGQPIEGGTFVYAIEEPITSLNWYNNNSTDLGKQVFSNLYDPMWKNNADGSLDYRLAKNVDISEDGTTYTLTLRDDIYWSDGEKITTDDIVFTLDTLVEPEVAPSTASGYKVDGEFCSYEKVSDTEIVFTIGRASNLFKKALGALYVLPAHCFEGVAATEVLTCEQNDTIATSGAFVVDSFNVGEKLVCVKNDKYYRLLTSTALRSAASPTPARRRSLSRTANSPSSPSATPRPLPTTRTTRTIRSSPILTAASPSCR